MTEVKKVPLFRNFNADDSDPEISIIESLCMNCEEQGTTRLLLTKIPFFKDIVVISFECPHCGFKNNEVQSAGVIQDEGIRVEVKISSPEDLNRKVVKQSSCRFLIPELDFEAPAFTGKGVLTTIEGLLSTAVEGLEQQQPLRRIMEPELGAKIDAVIDKLKDYAALKQNFTVILEDSSGNSFVENPVAPDEDPKMTVTRFQRSLEDSQKLGLSDGSSMEKTEEVNGEITKTTGEETTKTGATVSEEAPSKDEVFEFATNCSSCQSPCITRMKNVVIPHFKEIIIMAMSCDVCGHKSNEIKSGGGVSDYGTRLTLKMTDVSDLSRDVLKSETCSVFIPELVLECGQGTLGGKFTTLEGLLVSMKDQLKSVNPFLLGDSAGSRKQKMDDFLRKIDQVISGDLMVTVILDDPLGNSYMQNPYAPDPDPCLTSEHYTRTYEQNEDFGLNDIKTDGYT